MNQKKVHGKWYLPLTLLFCLVIAGCGGSGGGGTPPTNDVYTEGDLIIGDDDPFEVLSVGPQTRHFHTGNVFIIDSGTFRVDGGEFHLRGEDTNI